MGCANFKPFWPLALVQQALAVLVFVVRCPCGHILFCALGLTRRSSRPAYCGRLILAVRRGKAAQDQRAKRLLLRPTRMLQCFHSPSGHIAPQFAFGLVASCRSGRFRQSAVSRSHTGGRGHTGGAVQQTAPIWQQALPSLQDCPGLASHAQPALASDGARSALALRHAPTLPLQSL